MLSQSSTNKTEKHVFQTMNMIMMHNHVVSYTMGVCISLPRGFRLDRDLKCENTDIRSTSGSSL